MSDPADQNTVTTDTFRRIRRIFEEALERPEGRRRVFVENACDGDALLLREVNRMLSAEGQAAPLLDAIAPGPPSSSAPEEGRFPAGTVLAGRYRILGLLGKGGMGEVYRAHDLILNQTVALKFLTPANISEAALLRFRNEVRIARQVSHPNVCRVYDLGMVEGLHFLSMEYIDGEDLASLLRRIGRLPQDKAIEFTRKICAGLGAAHERGVLHRDLKPANIMIDGRGHVRITDFGLAGLAAEIPLSDLRSGTPAYMSPEQKAGKDVTTRSDLYSLGLVLHEMFTGKARKDPQSSPSELVKDLDPTIERLILRCLDEEPKRRPSSALSVAMALPGADPIAAALAAGETPSPEMVAASTEKEGFGPRTAVACFAGIVVLVLAFAFTVTHTRIALLNQAQVNIPPDALAFRAQDILRQLGYTETPLVTAFGFDCCNQENLNFLNRQPEAQRQAWLAAHQPPVLDFWYRQHRDRLLAETIFSPVLVSSVTADSPPNTEPGMVRVLLDAKGRLMGLDVRPVGNGSQGGQEARAFDWAKLFAAAGLDSARFSTTAPRQLPPMPFDARMAWTGTYADGGAGQIHIDAAAWEGRPVYLEMSGDWSRRSAFNGSPVIGPLLGAWIFGIALLGAVFVARLHLRSGRGDRRGATWVAGVAFLATMCQWLLTAEHVATIWEFGLLAQGISEAMLQAGVVWIAYLAIEPYVRRHWPDSLISWTRLQAGRLKDPLVASHVLAGFLLCSAGDLMIVLANVLVGAPLGGVPTITSLNSAAFFSAAFVQALSVAMSISIAFLLVVVLLRLLLRRLWIADVVGSFLIALLGGIDFSSPYHFAITATAVVIFVYAILLLLRRFGFLATVADWLLNGLLGVVPFTFAGWYAGRTIVALAVPIAIAGWALWVVLSAQSRPPAESAA